MTGPSAFLVRPCLSHLRSSVRLLVLAAPCSTLHPWPSSPHSEPFHRVSVRGRLPPGIAHRHLTLSMSGAEFLILPDTLLCGVCPPVWRQRLPRHSGRGRGGIFCGAHTQLIFKAVGQDGATFVETETTRGTLFQKRKKFKCRH